VSPQFSNVSDHCDKDASVIAPYVLYAATANRKVQDHAQHLNVLQDKLSGLRTSLAARLELGLEPGKQMVETVNEINDFYQSTARQLEHPIIPTNTSYETSAKVILTSMAREARQKVVGDTTDLVQTWKSWNETTQQRARSIIQTSAATSARQRKVSFAGTFPIELTTSHFVANLHVLPICMCGDT
jgi:hypothetical protein